MAFSHSTEVSKPILGTDFLSHFNLLVDIRQEKLMDGNTNQKIPGQIANISALQLSCLNSNVAAPYRDLLGDFPSLTRSSIAPKSTQHGISHAIVANDRHDRQDKSQRSRYLIAHRKTPVHQNLQGHTCLFYQPLVTAFPWTELT